MDDKHCPPTGRSIKRKSMKAVKTKKPATGRIDRTMSVAQILDLYPRTADIMAQYGLHCFNCSFSTLDSLEEGAALHNLSDDDLDNMVSDLNDSIKNQPQRPATLTVTESAAKALGQVMEKQGKAGNILQVIADGHGGFCMEFSETKPVQDIEFTNPKVPSVRITASLLTLERIGGATIDFREERFKLDIDSKTGCGCGGKCSCK